MKQLLKELQFEEAKPKTVILGVCGVVWFDFEVKSHLQDEKSCGRFG